MSLMMATTKRLLALLGLLPLAVGASPGCFASLPPSLSPGGASQNLTISSKSVIGKTTERRYIVHLPTNFVSSNTKPAPLIFALHGQLQPAWSMELVTQLSQPEFNKDHVVVYPLGLDVQDPGIQWLSDPAAPPSSVLDDRIFISELLTHLTSTLCIDESRIYATGVSNGGGLSALLACDPILNKKFAAFALIAAAIYPDSSLTEPLFEAGCNPNLTGGRKIPILEFHGTSDAVVAYDGNNGDTPASIPIPSFVDSWVQRNGCQGTTPVIASFEEGEVEEKRWSCGGKKDVVVHRKIEGFGHGWPSRASQAAILEQLRVRKTEWDATTVILEWFAGWRL